MTVIWLLPTPTAAGQVAVGDKVDVVAGRSALVDLLANDDRNGLDSVSVEIVIPPRHGTLRSDSTGALYYDPDPAFTGRDSLVYRLRSIPSGRFEIDTLASAVDFAADLAIPNLGSASDATRFGVAGHLRAVLWEGPSSVDSLSVVGVELFNREAASLAFDYGDLGVTVLTVNVGVQASDLELTLPQAGPTVVPGFAGLFTQTGNQFGFTGSVQISGSGALGSQVPSGVQSFDTVTPSDLAGLVGGSGDSSLVIVNLDISQSVDLAGNAADLRITGEIVGRGRVSPRGESGQATVYFDVVSGLATESADRGGWSLYPNPSTGLFRLEASPQSFDAVVVFDMLGRRVLERSGSSAGDDLDLSGKPPGVYVVRWVSGAMTGSAVLLVAR